MTRTALARFTLATLATFYAERPALANGRFPRAQQIVSVPGDASRVFLRATFGVLASFDAGASWRWLCEDAIGFSGTWDPPIAATSDARLYMGLEHGLAWTSDTCIIHAMPEVAGELVSDVSAAGADLFFATSTPTKPGAIWRVRSGVAKKTGATLDGFYIDTLDALGARVYATGIHAGQKPEPHFFRSDDGGKTIRELTSATWPTQGRLYLAAIDPKNDARILVRQLSDRGSDLLLSEDGGASFRVVLHMNGAMFGFAESADGASVWAGSGDAEEGLARSTDRGRTFTSVAKAPIFCLHRSAQKLFTCSNPFTDRGYAIGSSNDEGATITPLIGFADVLGPVSCDAGGGMACEKSWSAMHATFTATTASPSASAPPVAPSAPVASSASSASSSARSSSCACDVIASESRSYVGALYAFFFLATARVLRRALDRRRTIRPSPPRPGSLRKVL